VEIALVAQEGWVSEAITVLEKVQDSSSDSDSSGSTSGSSSHLAAHNLGLAWSLVNDTERAVEGTMTAYPTTTLCTSHKLKQYDQR
jgi:hypothetical protein